jgi:hypothetical protein
MSGAVAKLAGITFGRLSPSYWIDNLGFITEGKLTAIFIKPSLGLSNWPVIFTSSTNANKFSGTIITAASPIASSTNCVCGLGQEGTIVEIHSIQPTGIGTYGI